MRAMADLSQLPQPATSCFPGSVTSTDTEERNAFILRFGTATKDAVPTTRRKMAPLYLRGLLGSGGRKSVQPMAERLGLSSHDPLHHFISSRAWDDAPLWRVLADQVDRQVGGEGAVLVVDDSGLPKK